MGIFGRECFHMGNKVTDDEVEALAELTAPFGQRIKLEDVSTTDGVRLMRIRIQEGSRFTVFDIDPAIADAWGRSMTDWASSTGTIDFENGTDS